MTANGLLTRVRWHLYRTPAARAIKAVRRQTIGTSLACRRRLAAEIAEPRAAALAARLDRDGHVAVTTLVDPARLAALDAAGTAKLAQIDSARAHQTVTHKRFWTRLLDADEIDGALPTGDPFVAFALQPTLLAVLGATFGEVPQLDSVLLTFSEYSPQPLAFSQLWHRDYDDTRVIKLFAYLTDVDSLADGPLTFIPGPASDAAGFQWRSHRPDAEIPAAALASRIAIVAPRLSVFMVETSRCLHMGSRLAEGGKRLLYTATYIRVPRLHPEPRPRFIAAPDDSELIRTVISPA